MSRTKNNLHWRSDREFNFGDRLSSFIYRCLVGVSPDWVCHTCPEPYLTMVGSFLSIVNANAVVWGTGVISAKDRPHPGADYHAVRGPETRRRVLAAGGTCPELYGDPILALPKIYRPKKPRAAKYLGIIPHFREQGEKLFTEVADPNVVVLDITEDPFKFLDRLMECETVLSSSLHGLVAAHAYGIPGGWIQPTSLPIGDGIKFLDYLEGVGAAVPAADRRPTSSRELPEMARRLALAPDIRIEEFLAAFPGLSISR